MFLTFFAAAFFLIFFNLICGLALCLKTLIINLIRLFFNWWHLHLLGSLWFLRSLERWILNIFSLIWFFQLSQPFGISSFAAWSFNIVLWELFCSVRVDSTLKIIKVFFLWGPNLELVMPLRCWNCFRDVWVWLLKWVLSMQVLFLNYFVDYL